MGLPGGEMLWPVGSVNAYYTGSLDSASTTVGCQPIASDWSGTSVVWTTAPGMDVAHPCPSLQV